MSVANIRQRITNSEEAFEVAAFSDQSCVLTDATRDNLEQFSLELHVGLGWALTYSPQKNQLTEIPENGIKIPGRGSVVVAVKEKTKIPHNLYGVILPTGSLFLSHGILIAPAKIEPGFNGVLKLRLFNTTTKSHLLKTGDKLGSAVFFSTEVTVRSNEITNASQVAGMRERWYQKTARWMSLNKGWLIPTVTWFVSVAVAAWTYIAFQKPTLEYNQQKNVPQLNQQQIDEAFEKYMKAHGTPQKLEKQDKPFLPRQNH